MDRFIYRDQVLFVVGRDKRGELHRLSCLSIICSAFTEAK